MRLLAFILAIVFALPLLTTSAYADACGSAARAMANSDPKATLLSVKSKKNGNGKVTCEARMKISSGSQPPRIVVKRFKP